MIYYVTLQTLQAVDTHSETVHEHPLTLLAEEIRKLLKKETATFVPILSGWHPQVLFVSTSLLHKFYGIKLVSLCLSPVDVSQLLCLSYSILGICMAKE